MTVPATTRKAGPYAGNGVTTGFPFSFKVFQDADVQPVLTDANGAATNLVLNSDFSVLLNADQDTNPGGTVTYPIQIGAPVLPAGSTLTIIGGMPINQLSDITNMGRFLPQVFEDAYDKLTILIQQLKEVTDRTLQAAVGTTVKLIFPAPSSGKFLRWRSDLTGLENVDAGTDSMALQGLLADAGDVTHGTALIGWKANAAGSTGRTLSVKLGERLSVKDFGAVGDGVTDDTLAIQAAINFCGPLGRQLFFPRGSYVHGALTVSAGRSVQFIGESSASTFLLLNSATAVGFTLATDLPCVFQDLCFAYKSPLVGSAGAFIYIAGAVAGNSNSQFRNLQMNAPWVGIRALGAEQWVAERVTMGGYIQYAFEVSNTFNVDHGDSTIEKCLLTTTVNTAVAVFQRSSGGLRIINTKIIGGAIGYQMALASGANTSDLLITGCSIEGQVTAGITLARAGASGIFGNISITGNQVAGAPTFFSVNDTTPGWLTNVAIVGNSGRTTGGTCINFNVGDSIMISGNAMTGVGTETGVAIAAAVTNASVGHNILFNMLSTIINLSPSSAVAKRSHQGEEINITCSTAYGSFFSGARNVVFPVGLFKNTPKVTANISGGANGLAVLISNVTPSGCTLTPVALTTGAVVYATYRAEADY